MKKIFTSIAENNEMKWRVMLRLNIILLILLFVIAFGWIKANKSILIDIPPDLSAGATIKPGERQEHVVYDFALNIFQQVQRWKKDGKRDYPSNIAKYQAYITPQYASFLERDYERRVKKGELLNRQRTVQPIPGITYDAKRVKSIGNNMWVVFLDMDLDETYSGQNIKHKSLRYPMVVKSYDVDRQANPWGLALDGYYSNPTKISDEIKNEK